MLLLHLADIGDLVVLMAKRRYLQHADDHVNGNDDSHEPSTTRRVVSINQKMICHVFESDEVGFLLNTLVRVMEKLVLFFFRRLNRSLIRSDRRFK